MRQKLFKTGLFLLLFVLSGAGSGYAQAVEPHLHGVDPRFKEALIAGALSKVTYSVKWTPPRRTNNSMMIASKTLRHKSKSLLMEILELRVTYVNLRFVIKLSEYEASQNGKKAGEQILAVFSRQMGISKERLQREHDFLHELYGNHPDFIILDQNIDLLVSVADAAKNDDTAKYESIIRQIPDSPFKKNLIKTFRSVQRELRIRKRLIEFSGVPIVDAEKYMREIDKGWQISKQSIKKDEDGKFVISVIDVKNQERELKNSYVDFINESFPGFRKHIFALSMTAFKKSRKSNAQKPIFKYLEKRYKRDKQEKQKDKKDKKDKKRKKDEKKSEVELLEEDLYLAVHLYLPTFDRQKRKLMPRSAPFMGFDIKGMRYGAEALYKTSMMGAILTADVISAVYLGLWASVGVAGISALWATFPNLDHWVFGNPAPKTTWISRFTQTTMVMLPMAATFGLAGTIYPLATSLGAYTLMGIGSAHAYSQQHYFEAAFSLGLAGLSIYHATGLIYGRQTFSVARTSSTKLSPFETAPRLEIGTSMHNIMSKKLNRI